MPPEMLAWLCEFCYIDLPCALVRRLARGPFPLREACDAFLQTPPCEELSAFAQQALRALRERGIRCPDDVRVMSLTGHAIGNMLETTMTAMEVPALDMGRKAARMAIETVEAKASPGDKASVQHLVFSPTLVVRESA